MGRLGSAACYAHHTTHRDLKPADDLAMLRLPVAIQLILFISWLAIVAEVAVGRRVCAFGKIIMLPAEASAPALMEKNSWASSSFFAIL